MAEQWSPDSWRGKPVVQMPAYEDSDKLASVEAELATFPPLVFAGEARKLKRSGAPEEARARVWQIVKEIWTA